LQYESVQLSTFGRKLIGKKDQLIGYQLSEIIISDPHVIAISGESIRKNLFYTGNKNDAVDGMVFDITAEELENADRYEVSDYKRILAALNSGEQAWVYVMDVNLTKE